MLQLMGQKPKSTMFPLKDKAPDPSKVRGGHTLILLVTLAFCHVSNKETEGMNKKH